MAPPPLRIAILEADTPIGQARAKYGSYGGVFTSLLHKAADASEIPRERLAITCWDVVNLSGGEEGEEEDMGGEWDIKRRKGYPDIKDVDAVLITGSQYNAYDHTPWIIRLVTFIQEILAQHRVKTIGVCYGHQIVGRALGAKVGKSESGAWEVSVCTVRQTEEGRKILGDGEELKIFQMHKDHIYHYPSGVSALGSSHPCKVQGMFIPHRLVTVQGHPEFTAEIVAELLESRRAKGVFGVEIYKEAMGRVALPHDGVVVGRAFLRFLFGEGEGGGG